MNFTIYDHHEVDREIVATVDSNGLANGYLGPVPAGYCWYVERLTTWANATRANAVCEIFVWPSSALPAGFSATVGTRNGRVDVSTSASNDVSDEQSPIYVPAEWFLVAFWSGFTSADQVRLSTQIAVHQLPALGGSPQDMSGMHQHALAAEREARQLEAGIAWNNQQV